MFIFPKKNLKRENRLVFEIVVAAVMPIFSVEENPRRVVGEKPSLLLQFAGRTRAAFVFILPTPLSIGTRRKIP